MNREEAERIIRLSKDFSTAQALSAGAIAGAKRFLAGQSGNVGDGSTGPSGNVGDGDTKKNGGTGSSGDSG